MHPLRQATAAVVLLAAAAITGCGQRAMWWQRQAPPQAPEQPQMSPPAASLPGASGPTSLERTEAANPQAGASMAMPLTLARMSERQGQTKQARQLYQAILDKEPNNGEVRHRLGVVAAREGRFDEALEHLQRAQQVIHPPSAELLSDLGYVYYLLGRFEEGEAVLNEAYRIAPNHRAAANNMGLLVGSQERYDEALVWFRRSGSEAEAHANLAYVFAQNGELDKAEAGYLHALSLDNSLRSAAEALLQVAQRRQAGAQALAGHRAPGEPPLAAATPGTTPSSPNQLIESVQPASREPAIEQAAVRQDVFTPPSRVEQASYTAPPDAAANSRHASAAAHEQPLPWQSPTWTGSAQDWMSWPNTAAGGALGQPEATAPHAQSPSAWQGGPADHVHPQ